LSTNWQFYDLNLMKVWAKYQ